MRTAVRRMSAVVAVVTIAAIAVACAPLPDDEFAGDPGFVSDSFGDPPRVSSADAQGRPVILVHGFGGAPDNFRLLRQELESAGRPTYGVALPGFDNYDNAAAIRDTAAELVAAYPARDGGPDGRVDIVGHSMGGLSAQYYVQSLGGAADTANLVTMGSSHAGLEYVCDFAGPGEEPPQLCTWSDFIAELDAGLPTDPAAADRTRYVLLRSDEDGPWGRIAEIADCAIAIPDVSHPAEPSDPAFREAVVAALAGSCAADAA